MSADTHDLEVCHHEGYDPTINSLFVPAIKVPALGLVFLSGVTAAAPYHDHPHRAEDFADIPPDIEGQAPLLFEHLGQALAAAGSAPERVLSLTRFFANVGRDQDVVNRLQGEFLGTHLPTSATVEVTRLATHPSLLVEIQAVALA